MTPYRAAFRLLARSGLFACGVLAVAGEAAGQTFRYGRPGEPVHLTVGYQPYYTEAWSALVVRGQKLYAKHLPPGSTVQFKIGTKGAVMVPALRRGEYAIAYLGLAPALTAVQDTTQADLRAVAVAGTSRDLCNLILVRADAPAFADRTRTLAWLSGKQFAAPSGTCAELFLSRVLDERHLSPGRVIDQSIDVIPASLRAGKLDAVAVWEPTATRLVQAGLARRAVSGRDFGHSSAAFLVMPAELIEQRPDVVRAWLRAEREAQNVLARTRNSEAVVSLIGEQTSGLDAGDIRGALYADDGRTLRAEYPFTFTPAVSALLRETAAYMSRAGRLGAAVLRPHAVEPVWTEHLAQADAR